MDAKQSEVYWHIVRDGRLDTGMFKTAWRAERCAGRIAKQRGEDAASYQIVAARGRADLREMGIEVNHE